MNSNSTYSQFIYGKLSGGQGPYQIVGHTADLSDLKELQDLAENYKFWGAQSPGNIQEKEAVGMFPHQDHLILVQAHPASGIHGRYFTQYRYVFIPRESLARIGYRTFKLLPWLFQQRIPIIARQLNPNLDRLYIPLLDQQISKEEKQEEANLLNRCLKEKDSQGNSYLLSAVAALIKEHQLLINDLPVHLPAESYYLDSILLLLPAICRSYLSVGVANIDERYCTWAKLLIKTIGSDLINPRPDCLWLNRQERKIIGYNQQELSQVKYLRKISEIIAYKQDSLPAKILDELEQVTDSLLNLASLSEAPEDLGISSQTPIQIGIWGPTGSGKTTYLTKLHECIEQGGSDLRITELEPEARRFIKYNSNRLADNKFPLYTDTRIEDLNILTYKLTQLSTLVTSEITLKFIDAPGEFYEEIGEVDDEGNYLNRGKIAGTDMDLVDYLINCDGIIFLVDPEHPLPDNEYGTPYKVLLPTLFNALRSQLTEREDSHTRRDSRNRLKQYMAFCITKVDKVKYWNRKDEPEKLARDVLTEATVRALDTYCYLDEKHPEDLERNRCKFFAISSIGRYQKNGKGEWHPAVIEPERSESSSRDEKKKNDGHETGCENRYERGFGDKIEDETESSTKATDSQPNTPTEDSPSNTAWASPHTNWASHTRVENSGKADHPHHTPEQINENAATIIPDVNPQPLNVIVPIEWLIQSIEANPLSPSKISVNSTSQPKESYEQTWL